MRNASSAVAATLVLSLLGLVGPLSLKAQEPIKGDQLDPANYGPSYIESMAAAIERSRLSPPPASDKQRQPGENGVWMVPTRGASGQAHSGTHYLTNKWGDTRMGIGFPQPVAVKGAYFFGQADPAVWTPGVRAVGYRDGRQVAQTEWFGDIGREPRWVAFDMQGVDRIEIVSVPVVAGGGWYGMDDLTYTVSAGDRTQTIVLNFDDLSYRAKLTGGDYAGLIWETGQGDFANRDGVPGPQVPPGFKREQQPTGQPRNVPSDSRAEPPNLLRSFQGVIRGDAGSMSYPPDTDGAVGPNHYVETVNRNFAVYDKQTGAELINMYLRDFLVGSNGDPRVVFDHFSQRWFIHVCDFSATATIYLAVSLTDDPTGDWFKTSFRTAEGPDAGRWPDYPTLGVDQHGIYIAAYMVGGGSQMTIWAIDKAPLVAPNPSLGTITAWRDLPWEGAIQPAHTYGTADGEYLVSWASSSSLRVRRINPPISAPTLTEVGIVSVPPFGEPPNAPALGSTVPLNTVDDRLMMSVYRNGSLWTTHTIDVSGRAGCRWYEIDAASASLVQWGNVADSSLYYFFPSIMVNQAGDVVMGFTGSNSSQYAACYYTGRSADDPPGEMAPPVMYKEGTGPQNNIDSYGRNRWGDYSYTTLDPVDQNTFYTIQEYGHDVDIWGTYVGVLSVEPPDCNNNGIPDTCDIDCGPPGGDCDLPGCGQSTDCNENGIPDECEGGADCNENGVPDFCDIIWQTSQDCNENGVPDECDIDGGFSNDCQPNGVPDECEIGTTEIAYTFSMDEDPGWNTSGQWAWGHPTGGGGQYGGPDPTSGYTGASVCGYNLSGDYENNLPERHLTSTAIDCSNLVDVEFSFWRWLGVERSEYDHAYIRVSTNGSTWATIWENPDQETADTSWQLQEFDISAIADRQPTVFLRWTMGPTDGGWAYCGWNIDDVELRGTRIGGGAGDCNANAIPDQCDIDSGFSSDFNGNSVPDECEGLGDLNCDEALDFGDINPFVLRLSNPAGYAQAYPDCPDAHGDINGDGDVNFGDINPFVALLTRR